ncbi:MAG: hypothetical protein GXP09_12215 [Gammaproteobacteria bacterium]|nr:hypothetical protein [Gammaproteobacteria bacterium]
MTKFSPRINWVVSTLIVVFGTVLPAHANTHWQAQFNTPASGQLTPRASLRVALPEGLDNEVISWLALVLDSVDVSALVTLEGSTVILVPPQPLQPGDHQLRLVQKRPDGGTIERGTWRFQVSKAQSGRQLSVTSNISINPSYRISDGDIAKSGLPEKLQGTGTAQLAARTQGQDWQLSGKAELIYNSLPQLPGEQNSAGTNTAASNELELGEFLFTGRNKMGSINLGQHAVGADSLIMQQFYRRGLSVNTRSTDNRFYGTGFITRTEPIVGFRYGLGISDPDNRIAGTMFSAKPLSTRPEALTVSATYLQGQGQDQAGSSVAGDTTVGKGDAWGVAAESLLLSKRLRIRGEYAQTRFDFDGPNQGFGKESDNAQAMLVVYQPWVGKMIKNQPLGLQLGVEYKKIGTFFRSLANPGLPSDKDLKRVFGTANWAGLNVQASFGREEDNVNNISTLSRTRKEQALLTTSYTPIPNSTQGKPEDQAKSVWYRVLGTPTYAVSVQSVRDKTIYMPTTYQGGLIDSSTREVQLSANFNHTTWNWFANYYTGWQDDATNVSPDARNDMATLGVTFQAGSRVNVGMQVQKNVVNDLDNNLDTTSWLTNLNTSVILIPKKLTGTLSYTNSSDSTSDQSSDRVTQTVDFNLTWQARRAQQNRPGISLWLQGQYQDIEDRINISQNISPYQVFLGATVSWSATRTMFY